MPNPLFQMFHPQTANDGGFSQMIQQLYQFRSSFCGDAKAEVQRLLNSGQMSQAQFNKLSQIANQISGML